MTYPEWLERKIQARCSLQPVPEISFSIFTTLYERSSLQLFEATSESILNQDFSNFEWIVLAHGPIDNQLDGFLDPLARDSRVRIFREPVNFGIIGGMRYCLGHARNDYIIPIDADDLLTSDALRVLNHFVRAASRPELIYSDEDHLVDNIPCVPYFRPDFDPVLAVENSYIWHLCAIRRDVAVDLQLYSDKDAEWCHDWDTVLRMLRAGKRIVHIPEVLYHWRTHAASSTNKPDPASGSLLSQRRVLESNIHTRPRPHLYSVEPFPIFRGAFEWWIRRIPVEPARATLVVFGESSAGAAGSILRRSRFEFLEVYLCGEVSPGERQRLSDITGAKASGRKTVQFFESADFPAIRRALQSSNSELVAVIDGSLSIPGAVWPWDCQKLFEIHTNVAAVAGRVLDSSGRVLAGAEIFGYGGTVGCPDESRDGADSGYFALALKYKCVSAPSSALFMARKDALVEALDDTADWQSLGMWIGGRAAVSGQLVAFSPLFTGTASSAPPQLRIGYDEWPRFRRRFRNLIPDSRFYSRNFGPAYSLNSELVTHTDSELVNS